MQDSIKLFIILFKIVAVVVIRLNCAEGTSSPSLDTDKSSDIVPIINQTPNYYPNYNPELYRDSEEYADTIDEIKRAQWNNLQGGWGKRAEWNKLSAAWGKRPSSSAGWNNLSGMWGKRAKWNELSGMWGKRGWNDMNGAWGKRTSSPHWNKLRGMWGKRSVDDYYDTQELVPSSAKA